MKYKAIALLAACIMIATGLAAINAQPPAEKGNGIDLTGYHYNLNIIGKKANWNGNAGIKDNTSRHTMFVPQFTTETYYLPDGTGPYRGVQIWMSQPPEEENEGFVVRDGNAFDDNQCKLELAPGHYRVFIVAKAKPHDKDGNPYYTDITGWVQTYNDTDGIWYCFDIGDVHVTKSKKWQNITDLFWVTDTEDETGVLALAGINEMWVFEFLNLLDNDQYGAYSDSAYFWQFDNQGNKLVKVRFYPVENK